MKEVELFQNFIELGDIVISNDNCKYIVSNFEKGRFMGIPFDIFSMKENLQKNELLLGNKILHIKYEEEAILKLQDGFCVVGKINNEIIDFVTQNKPKSKVRNKKLGTRKRG